MEIKIDLSGSAIDTPDIFNDKLLLDTITNSGTEVITSTNINNRAEVNQEDLEKDSGTNLAVSNVSEVTITQDTMINENELVYTFDATKTGYASLVMEVVSGKWYLANVSFKSVKQSGFTPNHTSAEFRMFSNTQQNDVFDFKFELYDNNNELVHTSYTQSLAWQGGNTSITGTNNTIEGTTTIGSGIIAEGITESG